MILTKAHIETIVVGSASTFVGMVSAAIVPIFYPGVTGGELAYHRFWIFALGFVLAMAACAWLMVRNDKGDAK